MKLNGMTAGQVHAAMFVCYYCRVETKKQKQGEAVSHKKEASSGRNV